MSILDNVEFDRLIEDHVIGYVYDLNTSEFIREYEIPFDLGTGGLNMLPNSTTRKPKGELKEGQVFYYVKEKDEWEIREDIKGKNFYDIRTAEAVNVPVYEDLQYYTEKTPPGPDATWCKIEQDWLPERNSLLRTIKTNYRKEAFKDNLVSFKGKEFKAEEEDISNVGKLIDGLKKTEEPSVEFRTEDNSFITLTVDELEEVYKLLFIKHQNNLKKYWELVDGLKDLRTRQLLKLSCKDCEDEQNV